jgi:uncharacterized protein
MKHPVVWFEVMGKDIEKLQSFYAELFAWRIDGKNPRYGMVEPVEQGIPGGIGQSDGPSDDGVRFYVQSSDLAGTLARAEKLGGKTVMAPTKLMEVTIAMLADPEGHLIGLVQG